jgi:topoisomerase-4 subunit A
MEELDYGFSETGAGEDQGPDQDINRQSQQVAGSVSGMYKDWFLDYASYVILERAVPDIRDGLKPVQRRILHSMKRMDDGRYNKVANIIGHTMQFHPHGDASIGDALVQLGQKDLLVDTQGNWGNILTGDSSAAARYIEARLSKFALDVLFNPKTTEWKSSYDGRNREPVTLPAKFPLLLAMGVEGIAVGLASKILPHNFIELIDASISYLQGKEFVLYPDFPTGGSIDVARYNDGLRGGVIKSRAKIDKVDKKGLVISELPFGKTTGSLIESILKANEKGKIKIRKIDDNTSGTVEIIVYLVPGTSPDKTIDALYAFTDCEVSISPNSCVIADDRPVFMGVSDILRYSADRTLSLLRQELEIRLGELEEEWHYSSLEKIFIEERIYRDIEECETWEAVVTAIDSGLEPHKKKLRREVTHDDIVRLTEIKIKRISKYDSKKADEHIKNVEIEIEEVRNHLGNIVPYTINYFRQIKKKYGAGKERKTEIRNFDTIQATKVVASNARLYVNRKEGFIGTGLRKDEFVCECSDIDDIIVFRRDGTYLITKVADKVFVGKDIEHLQVFLKNDERTIYNVIYQDGRDGALLAKRCNITGLTRDKEYNLTKGKPGTKIMWFTANPNGEAEVVRIHLKPKPRLKKTLFEFDFGDLAIKGRASHGNIVTKNHALRITFKEKGLSTLGGRKIWFDDTVSRLNDEGRGKFLGEFAPADRILVVTRNGWFRTTGFDLSQHYEDNILLIEKFSPGRVFSAIYWESEQGFYYLKRFSFEETERLQCFTHDNPDSKLVSLTEVEYPRFEIRFGGKHQARETEIIEVAEFIAVKGYKAKGKRLTNYTVENIMELEPVVRKESQPNPQVQEESEDTEEESVPGTELKATKGDDPAQMKLEL